MESRARSAAGEWDRECDFLVVGSGGGGMTAALRAHDSGLDTLVIEASAKFGGSTGMSGGALWVPNNQHMPSANVQDSFEDGLQYVRKVAGERADDPKVRAYVEHAPQMVRYL